MTSNDMLNQFSSVRLVQYFSCLLRLPQLECSIATLLLLIGLLVIVLLPLGYTCYVNL